MSNVYNVIGERKRAKDFRFDKSDCEYMIKYEPETFDDLKEQTKGISIEKQLLFLNLTQSAIQLLVDTYEGIFDTGFREYVLQTIGTISTTDEEWLWLWANNPERNLPHTMEDTMRLKEIGEETRIPELLKARYPVDDGFEHDMGAVVCGLLGANAYYPILNHETIILTTITDESILKPTKFSFQDAFEKLPTIMDGSLDNKNILLNYLIDRNFKINISGDQIKAVKDDRDNMYVLAEFDEFGQPTQLSLKM